MTTIDTNDDVTLILKAQKGDPLAIETVISRFFWLVRSIVRKYFITNGTEEDLFQEGCLSIFKAVREYDPEKNKNVLAYMSMCIDSDIKDALRSSTRNKHRILNESVSLTSLSETGDDTPTEYIYDPVYNYIEREGLERFYSNIATLCSELHVKVLRYYLDGYTYAEIAALTGINEKKVDNIMFNVKKKIRENKKLFI